jgi:excisionase family DNA binding protein
MGDLLTVRQVAFILKVHPLTIRRYIREKKLNAVKISGAVRIKDEVLASFQKVYTTQSKHLMNTTRDEGHIFSLSDPLWRLEGVGMSINIPAK